MFTQYQEGIYKIKYKGRGVVRVYLKKNQAKALFEIMRSNQMEFESIELEVAE